MILGSQNVCVQILGKALDVLGLINVKLQVVCIEVIALENGGRISAKRLMYDGFDAVSRNDRLLRVPLDVLGRYKLLGDHDDSLARLRLFLIFPSGAMDLRISFRVGNLYMNEGDIGTERPQEKILFACKWTLHALYIFGRRSCLESLQHFGGKQRFDRNERKAQGASQITETNRQAAVIMRIDRARLPSSVYPVDRAKSIEGSPPIIKRLTRPAPTSRSVSRPTTPWDKVRFFFPCRINSWATAIQHRLIANPPSAMWEPSGIVRTTSATVFTLSAMVLRPA